MYPEGWLQQAFNFRSPQTRLSFGLVQKKGGPCGILAVVQAFILSKQSRTSQQVAGN